MNSSGRSDIRTFATSTSSNAPSPPPKKIVMTSMPTKILIIKLGYSETLDPEIGQVVSLGDVVRTTPILWALKEKFPDSHISWLVSEKAEPLLQGNQFIDKLMVWDTFVPFQLMKEKFDVLINLEKIPGVCALADMIEAWVKYGFRFDSLSGTYHGYEKGLDFISYIEGKKTDKSKGCWQQILIEMLGVSWKQQKYVLGYRPSSRETYDVGYNYEVGPKWPEKALPMEEWRKTESQLINLGYSVTWQQGNRNLFEYMDWINSCKLLITNDSLGLHLAFAFNKHVVGLFGPTDLNEVYFYYGCKVISSPTRCPYMPCCSPKCLSGKHCMSDISAQNIADAVLEIIPGCLNAQPIAI
jgi:heptosyltransferase-2